MAKPKVSADTIIPADDVFDTIERCAEAVRAERREVAAAK